MKMLKIVKEKSKIGKFLNEKLRIGVGFERLLFFVLLFTILCHIVACLWYALSFSLLCFRVFSARLDDFNPDTWVVRYGY